MQLRWQRRTYHRLHLGKNERICGVKHGSTHEQQKTRVKVHTEITKTAINSSKLLRLAQTSKRFKDLAAVLVGRQSCTSFVNALTLGRQVGTECSLLGSHFLNNKNTWRSRLIDIAA
jgi:hypothetical protein